MNNPLDPTSRELNDCGCCAGTAVRTPAAIQNRPGLPTISFRAGVHAQFKATLLAALSSQDHPALRDLHTREDDDLTISVLDAFSAMADVLTFYSERIANETYLRTATERRSVLELARAIGYELKPGVAAATWLAFTVETPALGSPGYANIVAGTKVQSVPGPDEKPQVYETTESILGRHEWNELHPVRTILREPTLGQRTLRLKGTATNLKPGDPLLIVGDERINNSGNENWDVRRVSKLEIFPDADPEGAYTLVTLDRPLGKAPSGVEPSKRNAKVFALRLRASLFGHNAPDWRAMPNSVKAGFVASKKIAAVPHHSEWPGLTLSSISNEALHLDTAYPSVLPGSWLVVETPEYSEVYEVVTAAEEAKTNFTLSSKTTRLTLRGENLREKFNNRVRDATVFAESEELPWAPEPAVEPIAGDTIVLDKLIPELPVPRQILVRGAETRVQVTLPGAALQTASAPGKAVSLDVGQRLTLLKQPSPSPIAKGATRWALRDDQSRSGWVDTTQDEVVFESAPKDAERFWEVATVRLAENTPAGRTRLTLASPLMRAYDPYTTTFFANVAHATHGESVKEEVLGSGDASRQHQQFTLKQRPLTYVPASTAAGAASTLEVWVNDIRWEETPTLYGHAPGDRVFTTRRADDGKVTVEFGDGQHGARLPSGRENVRAVYRKGIGSEGRVKAGQLSLLMTRPLGVKSVTNPLAPSEPADPQVLDDARRNAPRTVLTLDRVVSLQDYEDFTRDFPGVAKALATWTWSERTRGVLLSVLGSEGQLLLEAGDTLKTLLAALRNVGNPLMPVLVKSTPPIHFKLGAKVTASADRAPDQVLGAVRDALRQQFAFGAREFGQGVALSEVIALMQNVPGVDSVAIGEFARPDQPSSPHTAAYLPSAKPANGTAASVAQAAELLILDESSLANVELAKP